MTDTWDGEGGWCRDEEKCEPRRGKHCGPWVELGCLKRRCEACGTVDYEVRATDDTGSERG